MKNTEMTITMDDIVFEGRNKSYGAYQLRKSSGRDHLVALGLTTSFFLLLMLLTKSNMKAEEYVKEDVVTIVLEGETINLPVNETLPVEEKVQVETPPPAQDVAQKRYDGYNVQPDHLVDNTDHATMDEILSPNAQISNQTTEGAAPSPMVVDNIPSGSTTGPNASRSGERNSSETTTNDFVINAEEKPEFPGGNDAMMAFIYKNVKYTQIAIDNEIEGTAVIQFIIEKDGSVSNVEIVRDPGGGLGKEAEKVIKSMPRWKPGKQRQNPVRVKVSAPIKFKLDRR